MSVMRACPECGHDVPADAPKGLCPRCLMNAAADSTAAHPRRAALGGANPTPTVTLDEFRRAVIELQLADAEMLERIEANDPAGLARTLAQSRLLTPYQAGAILGGKARGLVIGRYLVLDRLGVGGMGVVFKALDRADPSQRVVALKILPPSFGRDADAVARFRREFEVTARLSHPNIVAALEANADRGVQFLTMEYISGNNLETLVRDGGSLPIKLALHCIIQSARGLEAAHNQRVIHRDIKPANLMLDDTGNVRVLDLGLARVIESTSTFGRSMRGTLTQTGAYMGTVDFLAPEQADDAKSADHRADIYSLGCTLYYLLAGRPPFAGDTLLKKLMAHQERPAPSLQTARPEVSDALEAVYQEMMAKRPGDRPQSMTAVIERLEACRGTAREAGDASADLKTFARTVMKRAQPKGKVRDTSVFARSYRSDGLQIGEGVNLEDIIGDYREELGHGEIPEEKLPPRPPRPVQPRKEKIAAVPWPLISVAAVIVAVVAAVVLLRSERRSEVIAGRPTIRVTPPAAPNERGDSTTTVPPATRVVSLFNGKDLSDWNVDGGDSAGWSVEGGVLVTRGDPAGRSFLLTDRDYGDFRLRLEVQMDGDASPGIGLRCIPGETIPGRDGEGMLAGHPFFILPTKADAPYPAGTIHWFADDMHQRPFTPVELKPAGEWNRVEIEMRGRRFRGSINGTLVNEATLRDTSARIPGGNLVALARERGRIGLRRQGGTIRYRNIEIEEIREETAQTRAKGKTLPEGALYVDDFDNPKSGWPSQTAEQLSSHAEEHHGYADGVYRIDANKDRTWWIWHNNRRPPEEFTCEVVGRVHGDNPLAFGSFALVVSGPGSSFQVKITTSGDLIYLRPNNDDASPPMPRMAGTWTHPTIKTGPKEFNTITLHMKKRKAYILVNGEMLGPPIALDRDATPALLGLGVDCKTANLRAEFDRISFRDLDEAAVAALESRSPSPDSIKLGNILYVDDFNDPKSGWDTKPWEMGRGLKPNLNNYENGTYYMLAQENYQGSWSTGNLTGMIAQDFQVEINGRVLGDVPQTPGAWGTIIGRADTRGIHVFLDRAGQLWLVPSFWGAKKFPNDRSIGPITHPAIRPSDQFNTMTVRVRGRRVEVLINHTPVLGPITLDWDLLPATANLTLSKPDFNVRIRNEYDRVEVRELLPPDAP